MLTKLKQTSDKIQRLMAVVEQKQREYVNKSKIQKPNIKIKDKVWLTLNNITTAIENKKFDAKQTKYTNLENMGFHNFRLNTPPGIRNVFYVDKLRAISADFLFSQISNDNHLGPTIVCNKIGTHEYDVEKILNKKGRGYQYLVTWKFLCWFDGCVTSLCYRCVG